MQGGDVSGLIGLFKETGSMLAGAGFVFYGIAVIKKSISHPEQLYRSVITYVVALIIYLLIISLI